MYAVCMARVNVYLPEDLAAEARAAGLNVSALTQAAIRDELQRRAMKAWLDDLRQWHEANPGPPISHEDVMRALDEAREELWGE